MHFTFLSSGLVLDFSSQRSVSTPVKICNPFLYCTLFHHSQRGKEAHIKYILFKVAIVIQCVHHVCVKKPIEMMQWMMGTSFTHLIWGKFKVYSRQSYQKQQFSISSSSSTSQEKYITIYILNVLIIQRF